jgi:hypothetical protein
MIAATAAMSMARPDFAPRDSSQPARIASLLDCDDSEASQGALGISVASVDCAGQASSSQAEDASRTLQSVLVGINGCCFFRRGGRFQQRQGALFRRLIHDLAAQEHDLAGKFDLLPLGARKGLVVAA